MYPRTTDMTVMLGRCRTRTRGFYDYWNSKRGGRSMPARRDIDPIEMKRWLPNIQLVDISHNPRRMVYRLVGEVDVDFRGYNPTGRTVEESFIGVNLTETLTNYDIVITECRPLYDWADFVVGQSGYVRTQETLLLPLSDYDDVVNMVLTYGEVDPKD